MTWLLALAYAAAAIGLGLALRIRSDRRIRRHLGVDVRPPPSTSLSGRMRRLLATPGIRVRSRSGHGPDGGIPDLLDLLAVSVTAGLSPRLALERAPEVVRGRCGEALAEVRRDVALGSPWHSALQSAAVSAGVPELKRLAVTLQRAERLGSPVAERLRDLAADVRAERRAQREERARRAPVRMLFPLVFLILPAFVLSAVVPALIVATRDVI